MSDTLQEPISVLCDEVGVDMPQPDERGNYSIVIDELELRVQKGKQEKAYMLGVIGNAETMAEGRQESVQAMLGQCLGMTAARFRNHGRREVLSLEPETGELILWVPVDSYQTPIPAFLAKATSLLNELEFWKRWLATP